MERKRILLAALALLLVGGGLLAYRRLSPSSRESPPPPVVYSADNSGRMSSLLRRFATLFGQGSGRTVTVGEVRRALSSATDDPIARSFVEEFQRDPILRKAWERHRDEEEAQDLVRDVVERPEFAKLLDRWQKTPGFIALAERMVGSMERDAAQSSASSARMLLTGTQAWAPTAPVSSASGRAVSHAPDEARVKSISGLMEPGRRGRMAADMETGPLARESRGGTGAPSVAPVEPGAPADDVKVISPPGAQPVTPPPVGGTLPPNNPEPGPPDEPLPGLGAIAEAQSETMNKNLKLWLKNYGLSPDVYLHESGGIWDVCFLRHELLECDSACKHPPSGTQAIKLCGLPPGGYWQACVEAGNSARLCLQKCPEQPPCVVDPAAYQNLCLDFLKSPRPAHGYDPHCMSVPGFKDRLAAFNSRKSKNTGCDDDDWRPTCFVAGTRVLTPAGGIPIETLRPGDRVLAADLQTGELVATEVLETFRSEAKGLRRLTFSNGLELRVTAEHPFFDPDTGGFRRARELALGDRVGRLSRRGGALDAFPLGFGGGPRLPPPARTFEFAVPAARFLETLTLIGIEELPAEGVPVYNFHVGERQNYFAEGVLVHNRKICD